MYQRTVKKQAANQPIALDTKHQPVSEWRPSGPASRSKDATIRALLRALFRSSSSQLAAMHLHSFFFRSRIATWWMALRRRRARRGRYLPPSLTVTKEKNDEHESGSRKTIYLSSRCKGWVLSLGAEIWILFGGFVLFRKLAKLPPAAATTALHILIEIDGIRGRARP